MTTLPKVLRSRLAFGVLCLVLSLSQGCARSEPADPANGGAVAEQKLPFRPSDPALANDGARPAPPPAPKLSMPFQSGLQPRILPSGTLLTVQLEDSLSTANVHTGDAFIAFVAAPLTLDGDTLIERGTAVTGRVESAQSQADRPGLVPGPGYFRLTLNAITVEGRQLPLQTSSLFARGTFQSSAASVDAASRVRSSDFRVQKGRPLTFRLTAPVALNDPSSIANRQNPGPPNE